MARKQWGRDEHKKFEEALVRTENDPNRFETIANNLQIPLEVVKHYYDALAHDIELIESGRYDNTRYQDYEDDEVSSETKQCMGKDKKKGVAWTAKEHREFLEGLAKYGRGNWKSISRVYVKTRTSTQVASHAQKYFKRQKMESGAKKRSSILDITLVADADDDDAEDVPASRSDLEATMGPAHFDQQMP